LDKIAGEVVFDHVDFSYVPGVPVIKDMSLQAQPGQTIALGGPTGAGKTTIINLLTRFYDIQGGSITIDGQDIRGVKKDSLRGQLGIVLQDTFLFSESVMENICYGRLDATDEECIEAAKLANANQFIRRLPKGYDTPLSERASNLSQGQRQLLAIARAVLADPGILILDEATSSVDTRTEARIQEAMLRLMEGPHQLCHRPPAEHHPRRRQDPRRQRRSHHRARHPRRTAGAARVLSQFVYEPVQGKGCLKGIQHLYLLFIKPL
jgi:ATP-binding cassette subfamily B protein